MGSSPPLPFPDYYIGETERSLAEIFPQCRRFIQRLGVNPEAEAKFAMIGKIAEGIAAAIAWLWVMQFAHVGDPTAMSCSRQGAALPFLRYPLADAHPVGPFLARDGIQPTVWRNG
jgi:hypothetical protein